MTLPLELGGIRDPQIQRALQVIAQQFPVVATGGGGGGGAPSGPAGGDLGSTYPNPTVVKGQAGFTVGGVAVTLSTDPALTNARTPTAHHATHEPGGTDAMAVDAAAATGSLRTIGTGALQATAGNDSRLTNARTPTAHATTHQPGGSDAMAVDAAAATGSLRTLGTGAAQAAAGNDSRLTDARTPTAHATTHQPGGSDAMAVDAAAATGSLRTLGTGAAQAAAGNDTRLSDARTPTAHATSHQSGGSDALALGSIAGSLVRAQTALTTKGDVLVTDGTTLHRLGVGANNTVLTADSTQTDGVKWAAAATGSKPPVVTTLPGSPADGDEVYYKFTPTAAPTTTVPLFWHLRFDSTTTRWYVLAGTPLFAQVLTAQTFTTGTYGDLATVGPSLTVPLLGDYIVEHGAQIAHSVVGGFASMSYAIGATAAVDADWVEFVSAAANQPSNQARAQARTAVAAATAFVAKYRTSGATATFSNRWMKITPVRV